MFCHKDYEKTVAQVLYASVWAGKLDEAIYLNEKSSATTESYNNPEVHPVSMARHLCVLLHYPPNLNPTMF